MSCRQLNIFFHECDWINQNDFVPQRVRVWKTMFRVDELQPSPPPRNPHPDHQVDHGLRYKLSSGVKVTKAKYGKEYWL